MGKRETEDRVDQEAAKRELWSATEERDSQPGKTEEWSGGQMLPLS